MKKEIHPEYKIIEVVCTTCDKKHVFGSTVAKANVDVCSNCHSFYTGDRSKMRSTGRIDRFIRRENKQDK